MKDYNRKELLEELTKAMHKHPERFQLPTHIHVALFEHRKGIIDHGTTIDEPEKRKGDFNIIDVYCFEKDGKLYTVFDEEPESKDPDKIYILDVPRCITSFELEKIMKECSIKIH